MMESTEETRAIVREAGKAVEVLARLAASAGKLEDAEFTCWAGELLDYGWDLYDCLREEVGARHAK